MRIRIILSNPTVEVPVDNQHYMNGFINAILGEGNKYHDKFSDYAISSLQGGKLNKDKKTLSFPREPYFYVSTLNGEFMADFLRGTTMNKASMFGMHISKVDMLADFRINKYYDDMLTISPILLTNKSGWKLTFKKNPEWLALLKRNCIDKLRYAGIEDDTFNIEIINSDKAKEKTVWVGKVFNPASQIKLRVYGKPETRNAIYSLGFGKCTGSGFGSVDYCNNPYRLITQPSED